MKINVTVACEVCGRGEGVDRRLIRRLPLVVQIWLGLDQGGRVSKEKPEWLQKILEGHEERAFPEMMPKPREACRLVMCGGST